MTVTTTNLTMGPGTFWSGAFGVAEPAATSPLTAPGVGWRDVGGTQDGVTLNIALEYTELEVDQLADVPERRLTKREMTLATNLAETTLDNLALVLNEPDPGVAVAGVQTFSPTSGPTVFKSPYRACLFDGPGQGAGFRRVIARKTLNTEGTEFAYAKDGQNVYSVSFACHYISDAIKPYTVTDTIA